MSKLFLAGTVALTIFCVLIPSTFVFLRRIGKDLSNTFAKLEKLTICKYLAEIACTVSVGFMILSNPPHFSVAKRKSLFDDKSVEIEELTYIIKQVRGHS